MIRLARDPKLSPCRGFTLVEALVAISMTALAGSVLLLGVTSSVQSTDEAYRQTVALGLAQQLMDEVVGGSIAEIDKYNGFSSTPPVDGWGVALGTGDGNGGQRHANFRVAPGLLDNYCCEVRISRVAPSDLNVSVLSHKSAAALRLVTVRVTYNAPNASARELAELKRSVAYVPQYESLP